jgi:hypothetical protein
MFEFRITERELSEQSFGSRASAVTWLGIISGREIHDAPVRNESSNMHRIGAFICTFEPEKHRMAPPSSSCLNNGASWHKTLKCETVLA